MKQINIYIKESLESDNLLWLLDTWFNNREDEQQEFIDIVVKCISDHNVNNLETYLKQSKYLKDNYIGLVNFLLDDIEIKHKIELDYIYQLKEVIKQLIANKSNKNKYIIAI